MPVSLSEDGQEHFPLLVISYDPMRAKIVEIPAITGRDSGFKRKIVQAKVKNEGLGNASDCAVFVSYGSFKRQVSWDNGEKSITIPAEGAVYCNVAFSDSRLETMGVSWLKKGTTFLATSDAIQKPHAFFGAELPSDQQFFLQPGFHTIDLIVENSQSRFVNQMFRLNVSENWSELSLQEL